MRVLVCGGRLYNDIETLDRALGELHAKSPIDVVIHGAAAGADTLAGAWAKRHGIPTQEFRADWIKHRRSAGPIRNRDMLEIGKPDLVVAFPGERGTRNMMEQARVAGVPVAEIK
jgi:hypothetical protein